MYPYRGIGYRNGNIPFLAGAGRALAAGDAFLLGLDGRACVHFRVRVLYVVENGQVNRQAILA
jgi:hypothetical protein